MEIIDSYNGALNIRAKFAPYQTSGWHFFYRGHASTCFKLLSMVGRKPPLNGDILESEQSCFNNYLQLIKNENWLDFKLKIDNEELFYMSIGRHLGLDCRLLDWTSSLDTALFFATSNEKLYKEDGHLWMIAYHGEIKDFNVVRTPFTVNELTLVKEDYYLPDDNLIENQPLGILRRMRQNGFFTITPSYQLTTPLNKLETDNIHFIPFEIKANAKSDILKNVKKNEDFLCLSKHSKIEDDIKSINAQYFKQQF